MLIRRYYGDLGKEADDGYQEVCESWADGQSYSLPYPRPAIADDI